MNEFKIVEIEEFKKDLKKLKKRFRSIEEDLKIMVGAQLKAFHFFGVDNKGIVRLDGVGDANGIFYKVRKFACKSLKGKGNRSGIRVIYLFDKHSKTVTLIEIYYKQDKETESQERINKFIK